MEPNSLLEEIGGRSVLEKVHKIFYDKLYEHPWLKGYFDGIDQKKIEDQQTDFMMQLTGGPKIYAGKTPKSAHQHILITDELFELRSSLLSESIKEAGLPDELRKEWLAADATFKRILVKKSAEECSTAYPGQPILNFQ